MTRIGKLASVAVIVLATAAGVASASATIPTTALPLSATGEDVNDPQVAVDPNGNAFYAWVRDEPGAGTLKFIQAARVSSTGTVGTVHTVSIGTESASSPAIAASSDGTGIVVWQEFQSGSSDRRIRSARINANGTLGTTQTMSNLANDVTDPDVGIDGTGKALVVWTNLDGNDAIEARTRSAADALGSIEDAASQATVDAQTPDLAVAPSGVAILAFHRAGALEDVRFRRRLANGTWDGGNFGTGLRANPVAGTRDSPQVAVDPTGDADAVVVWRETFSGNTVIQSRRVESTETEDLAGPLGNPSDSSQNADQPQVDVDGNGIAYLTWRRSNGTVTVPQFRFLSTSGFPGATTHNLNPTGALSADQPQVAVDTAGNATFVWRFGLNIETRSLPGGPGGTLTPIQALTTTGSNTEPRVDANAAGARWGAYRLDTAGNDQAFGFFDLTAPTGPDTTPPDTVITSGPADGSTTSQTTVTFGFTNVPEEAVTFQCSVDGGAFGPCSGPGAAHTAGPLAPGAHTFQVGAVDTSLNADPTPAQSTFTVIASPTTPAKKKCKKGRKLKKGKCVKKKRKRKR